MRTLNRHYRFVIIALLVAVKLFSSAFVTEPVGNTLGLTALQATRTPAPTATPRPTATTAPPVGDVIPITSLKDVKSLEATVNIGVNGVLDGEKTVGNLTAQVTTNDQNRTKIEVTGDLLGDVVASIGGAAVNLFGPSKVTIYKVPEGTYIVVHGLFEVCVKAKADESTAALDQLSPIALMNMLTGSDVARGKLVGTETRNGQSVKHYVINGDAFLTAAQKSNDPALRTFSDALWSAEDADLYVSSDTGYPVAYRGTFSGEFEPLGFQGHFGVDIALTGMNNNTNIVLPSSCNNPISQ